jgi:hypothetical protein
MSYSLINVDKTHEDGTIDGYWMQNLVGKSFQEALDFAQKTAEANSNKIDVAVVSELPYGADRAFREKRLDVPLKVLRFNGEELTPETIEKTRKHFADNQLKCVNDVNEGVITLPDHVSEESYFESCVRKADQFMSGDFDHSFTFLQRAYWIQTGKDVALLP